ncbi:disulfide bond formation protein B [Halopseudomonas salegens]|uniref:Disulfide bond formation protein B n=1 Tax=Halopseudomonas salegens TaxID=1434072 RepID=A0A1H2E3H3_9GAMM|nr:disulfide bond formation protein B [Halopseudomonas salegens]SDT89595.1 disulfide bond formation protein DsbB [Halopseudomonas salegens]
MSLPASRTLYLITFLACLLIIASAYYMELVLGLQPCPLCWIQRICFILVGLISLAALLHNPQPRPPRKRAMAARGYAVGVLLATLFGATIAGRQIWLQHQPPETLASCLPSMDYMLDVLPFRDMLQLIFSGTADCAAVTWTFLGLSIAEGSMLLFILLTLFGLTQLLRSED